MFIKPKKKPQEPKQSVLEKLKKTETWLGIAKHVIGIVILVAPFIPHQWPM